MAVAEAAVAMSRPRCSTGKKGTGSVSRIRTGSRRILCAVGAPNRRASVITGGGGRNRPTGRGISGLTGRRPAKVGDRMYSFLFIYFFDTDFVGTKDVNIVNCQKRGLCDWIQMTNLTLNSQKFININGNF